MKKHYFFLILSAIVALTASASKKETIKADILRHDNAKQIAPMTVTATASTLDDEGEVERDWEELDEMGTMVDDILTGLFDDLEPMEFPVTVEEDKNHPGYYRIVNPWMFHPMRNIITRMWGGTLTLGPDVTIEIDATDPDYVVIPKCAPGVGDEEGMVELGSLKGMMEYVSGISVGRAKAMAGKLENGAISFQQPTALLFIQGENVYYTNLNGKFALMLPGAEAPIDYEIRADFTENICHNGEGIYHFTVKGDERIPEIRYGLSTGIMSKDVDKMLPSSKSCKIGEEIEVSVKGVDGSHIYVLFASMNEDGDWEERDYVMVFTANDTDTWEDLGYAPMTEGLLSSYFEKKTEYGVNVETYKVLVQEHKTTPGYYRIVNPYEKWSLMDSWSTDHNHPHYLYINATHPENVYFEQSALGVHHADFGEFSIKSNFAEYVDYFGYETAARNYSSDGRMVNGEITFGADSNILLHYSKDPRNTWWYTNIHSNPDFDIDRYKEDPTYNVPRFIPGDFLLDLDSLEAAVEDIISDNSEAEAVYYNLQGIRVENPENGIFIRCQGSKAKKVAIK